MGQPARSCAGAISPNRKEILRSGFVGKHPSLASPLESRESEQGWDFQAMENYFDLRNPAEPMPPPVKEPPPDGPESPDVPVREPEPDEPGEI
jgi:hypothetical protein